MDVHAEVPGGVQADDSMEGIGDIHEQRTIADPMVSLGSPYFTMSDLLGSRLAPQSPGGGILLVAYTFRRVVLLGDPVSGCSFW